MAWFSSMSGVLPAVVLVLVVLTGKTRRVSRRGGADRQHARPLLTLAFCLLLKNGRSRLVVLCSSKHGREEDCFFVHGRWHFTAASSGSDTGTRPRSLSTTRKSLTDIRDLSEGLRLRPVYTVVTYVRTRCIIAS